ncbi:MAG: hypothetical protein JXA67_07750, partial [Micromonosporaceae bacterium]|nr:hypothetical protein [Micromonosporaceae bacterium]
ELLLFEHPPLHDTDLGERVRRVLPQALEALLPAAPTVEDRIRAAAALGIVKSALDNLDYLADGSCPGLREIVMKLATSALDRQAS